METTTAPTGAKSDEQEKDEMAHNEPINIFQQPTAGGMDGAGLGLGGGLIGGVLLGALLGRNGGLFGGGNDGVSGLNNLQGAIDTNAILSNLGDIKDAVPLAEAQVQLALAGVQKRGRKLSY
ncbi:hypothetical protein [Dickeya phage Sucellus]|nr:hypothetical protein [Dickeya phage Sucellus]